MNSWDGRQFVLLMLYGQMCEEYIRARALVQEVQGNMVHYWHALAPKLCNYINWLVFTCALGFR
jgi:hypothetical protein